MINEDFNKKFEELLEILKLIENKEFFVTIRNTYIPDRKIMKSYLEMLLNHLNDDKVSLIFFFF